jgi:hypothetical protein
MYVDRGPNGERNKKRSIKDRLGGLNEPINLVPLLYWCQKMNFYYIF